MCDAYIPSFGICPFTLFIPYFKQTCRHELLSETLIDFIFCFVPTTFWNYTRYLTKHYYRYDIISCVLTCIMTFDKLDPLTNQFLKPT